MAAKTLQDNQGELHRVESLNYRVEKLNCRIAGKARVNTMNYKLRIPNFELHSRPTTFTRQCSEPPKCHTFAQSMGITVQHVCVRKDMAAAASSAGTPKVGM